MLLLLIMSGLLGLRQVGEKVQKSIQQIAREERSVLKRSGNRITVYYVDAKRVDDLAASIRKEPDPDEHVIIVCTNVLESSHTMPYVHNVISTAYRFQLLYDSMWGALECMYPKLSKEELFQQRGRCGRVADGVWYCFLGTPWLDHAEHPPLADPADEPGADPLINQN